MLHLEVIEICLGDAYLLYAHIEQGHPVQYIKGDGKYDECRVRAQCNPPEQLLVQLLLEVLQHEQADGQSSHSTGQVGYIRHGRRTGAHVCRQCILASVACIDGKTEIKGGCKITKGRENT